MRATLAVKRPSPQLIAAWYAKLRATGFRDIEGGGDIMRLSGWTFRSSQHAAGWRKSPSEWSQLPAIVPLPDGFEPEVTLADHPTAVYYRGLEHAARALKGKPRRLVLAASNEGAAASGRALNMSRRTASYQVRRFAIEAGLLREAHGS